MTLGILTFPIFRAFDSNGLPLAGGKLYSYLAGTTTPAALLAADGSTALANPVVLDSIGQAAIRLQSIGYKLDLFDAANVHQDGWPVDNVNLLFATTIMVAVATLSSVNGASLLTAAALIPAGARVLTVSTKILADFGASGGLTGFAVGDGALIDRWGISAALTTNALTGSADAPAAAQQRDASVPLYPSATAVVVSAQGGLFDTAGSLQVSVQYLLLSHRSA